MAQVIDWGASLDAGVITPLQIAPTAAPTAATSQPQAFDWGAALDAGAAASREVVIPNPAPVDDTTLRREQSRTKADAIAKALSRTPPLGVGEHQYASMVAPEDRELVLEAARRQFASDQSMQRPEVGYFGKLATSAVQGAMDFGMPLAKMAGVLPKLDPEQERFKQELLQAREEIDPTQASGFGGEVQKAARMATPMVMAMGAGGATGAFGKAAGLGVKGTLAATSAGVSGSFLPMTATDTYEELIGEGFEPGVAKGITAVSAPIEAAIESILPNPFTGYAAAFKGSARQVAVNLVKQYAVNYGKELSEEVLQGMTRETAKEVARAIDEEIPNQGIGRILMTGFEAGKESAIPLALMMAPGASFNAAQNVSASRQRAGRLEGVQQQRGSDQDILDLELSTPEGVRQWADANPDAAQQVAAKDSLSRQDWKSLGLPDRSSAAIRKAFAEQVRGIAIKKATDTAAGTYVDPQSEKVSAIKQESAISPAGEPGDITGGAPSLTDGTAPAGDAATGSATGSATPALEPPADLARRAARGESIARPEGISDARWRAMIAQQATRMGLKPPATPRQTETPSELKPEAPDAVIEGTTPATDAEADKAVQPVVEAGVGTQQAKQPWQMTAEEAANVTGLTWDKWQDSISAAQKAGKLTEDSPSVRSSSKTGYQDWRKIASEAQRKSKGEKPPMTSQDATKPQQVPEAVQTPETQPAAAGEATQLVKAVSEKSAYIPVRDAGSVIPKGTPVTVTEAFGETWLGTFDGLKRGALGAVVLDEKGRSKVVDVGRLEVASSLPKELRMVTQPGDGISRGRFVAWNNREPKTGEPIVAKVWHGTGLPSDKKYGVGASGPMLGPGKYWAGSPEHAKSFGDTVVEGRVHLNNPFVLTNQDQLKELAGVKTLPFGNAERSQVLAKATEEIKRRGHDGVVISITWEDDMDREGKSLKRLREIAGTSQIVQFTDQQQKPTVSEPSRSAGTSSQSPSGEQSGTTGATDIAVPAPAAGEAASSSKKGKGRKQSQKSLPEAIADKVLDVDEMEAKEAAANAEYDRKVAAQQAEVSQNEKQGIDETGSGEGATRTEGVGSGRRDLASYAQPGKEGKLALAGQQPRAVRYYATEDDGIVPSHDARRNFAKNPEGDINERPYQDPKEGASSRAVVEDIAKADPAKIDLLISDTLSATDGPPVTNSQGIVLGGNARSMGIQLAYHRGGETAKRMKEAMVRAAEKFGLDPAAVEKMERPVIVRELADAGQRGEMSSILNEPLTAGKSQATIAASRGSKLSESTVDMLSSMMVPDSDGNIPSVRDVLRSVKNSDSVLRSLQSDGVLSERDVDQYIDPDTGQFNDAGRAAVEELLLGKVVGDPSIIGDMAPSVRNKVISAVGPLVRGMADKKHGTRFTQAMRDTIAALPGFHASGHSASRYFLEQKSLLGDMPGMGDETVAILADNLVKLGPVKFRAAIKEINESLGVESGSKQSTLFGNVNKVASFDDAVIQQFGRPARTKSKGKKASEPEELGFSPSTKPKTDLPRNPGVKPISAADVIKTWERDFGMPIRTGKVTNPKASGIYKWLIEVVRLRSEYATNLAVASHEVAHHVDKTGRVLESMPPDIAAEIEQLDYEPGRADRKLAKREGWAEFVRMWITGEDTAAAAPAVHDWFEGVWSAANPEIAEKFAKARQHVERWSKQGAFARATAMIPNRAARPVDVTVADVAEKIRTGKNRFMRAWMDGNQGLKVVAKEYERQGGKFDKFEDPYSLKLAFDYTAPSHAERAIKDGVHTVTQDHRVLGPSLASSIKGLKEQAEYDEAQAYAIAIHTQEMHAINPLFNTSMDIEDANYIVDQINADPAKLAKYQKAAETLTKYNDGLIQMIADAGVITSEEAERILDAYDHYVPLLRILNDKQLKKGAFAGAGMANLGPALRGRTKRGSGLPIVDIYEASMRRSLQLYSRALKQQVIESLIRTVDPKLNGKIPMGKLAERLPPDMVPSTIQLQETLDTLVDEGLIDSEQAEDVKVIGQLRDHEAGRSTGLPSVARMTEVGKRYGVDFDAFSSVDEFVSALLDATPNVADAMATITTWRPSWNPSPDKHIVRFIHKGKPVLYQLDSLLYDTVTGMDKGEQDVFTELARTVNHVFKTGAVGISTGFGGQNIFRDWDDAQTHSTNQGFESTYTPFVMLAKYLYAEVHPNQSGSDEFIKLFDEFGGGLTTRLGYDAKSQRKTVGDLRGVFTVGHSVYKGVKKVESLISATDVGPRLAEFVAVMNNNGFFLKDGQIVDSTGKPAKPPRRVVVKAINAAGDATTNFKRIGTSMRRLDAWVPFTNAAVQSRYRQYKAGKSLLKPTSRDAQRFLISNMARVAAAVAFWAWVKDDDDDERANWLKDGYWVFSYDGQPVARIAKSRDYRAMYNLVDAILDDYADKKFGGSIEQAQTELIEAVSIGGGGVIREGVEQLQNWDHFRDSPIEDPFDQKLEPWRRGMDDPQIATLSKAIGTVTGQVGFSPARVEHLLGSSTGGAYRRWAKSGHNVLHGKVSAKDVPFVSGIVMDRDYHQSLGEFYQLSREVEMKRATEKLDGDVSPETDARYENLSDIEALMTEIRAAEREGSQDAQRTREFEPYIIGLARDAIGKKPLEKFPNPMEQYPDGDLPSPVRSVIDEYEKSLRKIAGNNQDGSPSGKPVRQPGETDAKYQGRYDEWVDERTEATKALDRLSKRKYE